MRFLLTVALLAVMALSVFAEDKKPQPVQFQGELIFLRDFGTDEVGYLSIPQTAPSAGIVLAHGKFGLSQDIRLLCDRLAQEGYLALAVDLFNGNIPRNPEDIAKNDSAYSSDIRLAAINTGISFFQLSPRFKMEKVILLGIGESARDVLGAAQSNHHVWGVTLVDPEVLPTAELINQIGVPIQAFVSSERDISIDVEEINREADAKLEMSRMPQVIHDEESAFKRHINERVWKEAESFWDGLSQPERSITDRIIESVF